MADDSNILSRRWARLIIHPSFLVALMSNKDNPPRYVRIVKDALPADAEYISVRYDPMRDCLYLIVESATFDPINEGDVLPELPSPIFELVTP